METRSTSYGSPSALRGERGATIIIAALAMTVLLSMVALAIDVGMLLTARSEAQRAADAAALAGAGSLIPAPTDAGRARAVAMEYGGLNDIQDQGADVRIEDVQVDLAQLKVTATVSRIAERGNGVGTWFARMFGVDVVDVSARAAARVSSGAGTAICVKPWAIFDRYADVDADGQFTPGTDPYDPALHGYGSTWRNAGQPGDDGLGYVNDLGRPITLKGFDPTGPGGSGGGSSGGGKGGGKKGGGSGGDGGTGSCCPGTGPSWAYPWDIPQPGGGPSSGASRYRDNIQTCNPSPVTLAVIYPVENGTMHGPTVQGTTALIAQDPGAYWDAATQSIKGSIMEPAWEASPRIGIVPTFDPARDFHPGKTDIQFSNFVAVFIESVSGMGNDQVVNGRILYPSGVAGGGPGAPGLKYVQLVE